MHKQRLKLKNNMNIKNYCAKANIVFSNKKNNNDDKTIGILQG